MDTKHNGRSREAVYKLGRGGLTLAQLLRLIMARKKLSVRNLAKLAGVSPTIIQSVRSGKKENLNLDTFFAIIEAMGCTCKAVIGEDTPTRKAPRFFLTRKMLRSVPAEQSPYEEVVLQNRGSNKRS